MGGIALLAHQTAPFNNSLVKVQGIGCYFKNSEHHQVEEDQNNIYPVTPELSIESLIAFKPSCYQGSA